MSEVLFAGGIDDIIQRAVREAVAAAGLRAEPPAPIDPDAMLTRKAAAAALTARGYRISDKTLSTLVSRGGGPAYRRFGSRVIYKWSDLLAWAEARLSAPRRTTAEADRTARRPAPVAALPGE